MILLNRAGLPLAEDGLSRDHTLCTLSSIIIPRVCIMKNQGDPVLESEILDATSPVACWQVDITKVKARAAYRAINEPRGMFKAE